MYPLNAQFSHDEQVCLIAKAQAGDDKARHNLFEANINLVWFVLNRIHLDNIEDTNELFSYGVEGLSKAIDGFDASRNYKFSSYAVACINDKILKGYRKTCLPLGYKYKEDFSEVPRVETTSIFADEDRQYDKSLVEMLASDEDVERDVERDIMQSELSVKIKKCLSGLKDRRRRYIVEHVFGVNGKKKMTYVELGKKYGISKQRVDQLLKDSLKKLQGHPVAMTLMEGVCNV